MAVLLQVSHLPPHEPSVKPLVEHKVCLPEGPRFQAYRVAFDCIRCLLGTVHLDGASSAALHPPLKWVVFMLPCVEADVNTA